MVSESITAAPILKCAYCGYLPHEGGMCPLIKEIEYFQDGTTKRVVLTKEA